jgi:hypothetical protein
LPQRVDFRSGLSLQFPAAPHRVLYTKGGQYLAAARLDDPHAVLDHKVYWATTNSVEEARYIAAVLNSPALTQLLAPLQSRGEHNPRDFDKLVWRLPIPLFDPQDEDHARLADLAARAETVAAATDVSSKRTFQAQRRLIREVLEHDGISVAIDELVLKLLSPQS